MNNFVDVKITVWNRLHFSEDADMKKVLSIIKKKGATTVMKEKYGFVESETLFETEQQLEPEKNSGKATIEVYEDHKLKWKNSIA